MTLINFNQKISRVKEGTKGERKYLLLVAIVTERCFMRSSNDNIKYGMFIYRSGFEFVLEILGIVWIIPASVGLDNELWQCSWKEREKKEGTETNRSGGNGKGERYREREEEGGGGVEREREEGKRERERDLSCFIINTIAAKKPVEQVLSSTICF